MIEPAIERDIVAELQRPDASELEGDAAKEILKLRGWHRLDRAAIDRWLPCSDHRDKTEREVCYVCRAQSLRVFLQRMLEWDGLDGSSDGQKWRRDIEGLLERTGVNKTSAF